MRADLYLSQDSHRRRTWSDPDGAAHPVREDRRWREHRLLDEMGRRDTTRVHAIQPGYRRVCGHNDVRRTAVLVLYFVATMPSLHKRTR